MDPVTFGKLRFSTGSEDDMRVPEEVGEVLGAEMREAAEAVVQRWRQDCAEAHKAQTRCA